MIKEKGICAMYNLTEIGALTGNLFFIWLTISVLFLFMEIGTPGLFFFVAFSVGSCGTALCSLFIDSIMAQCLAFLTLSGVAFVLLKAYISKNQPHEVRTNIHALIGKHGIVTKKIEHNLPGRVNINGEEWHAKALDNHTLK